MEFIAVGCRFTLAAVFFAAGLGKLGRRREFERAVRGYGLVPARAASLIARSLPPLELACAALLVGGFGIRAVAVALAVLLAALTFAITFDLARGRRIDCGCFGNGVPRSLTWNTVARNVILGSMAVFTAAAAPRALSLDELFFGPAGELAHADAVAAAIATAALLLAVSLLVEASRLRAAVGRAAQVLS